MNYTELVAIAHTLDANCAPLALVQDFADMAAELGGEFSRPWFIYAATTNLRASFISDMSLINKEMEKSNA